MKNAKTRVEKILSGNIDLFTSIIQDYQRLVNHIVYRMIPNSADREDICQDIFIQVYQNLGNFKFQSKLSTWIARIAYNRCINYLKKKKTALFDDLAPENKSIESHFDDSITPDTFSEQQDRSSLLRGEIDRLPPQFRAIITLFHCEEMKYSEISEITGLPEGTVKSYLFRARKLLKKRLMRKYEVGELV